MTEGPYDFAAERLDAMWHASPDDWPRRMERSVYSSEEPPSRAELADV